VLSKGPERDGTTPFGGSALDETIGAGVNFFKTGPPTIRWTDADITDANLWNRAVAARGAYAWVNLSTVARATPGDVNDTWLRKVITTLKGDPQGEPGIGMWKGADEPWWSQIPASSLRYAYCLSTSRGDPSACMGQTPLDSDHLWVTIQAPMGTAADLQPYSAVTDTHGVDKYPLTYNNPDPDLHTVGTWTATIASITPSQSVWTTLQICSSGSVNPSTGAYVLPTRRQARYMLYDAIINGARSLGFFGGNNVNCWTSSDQAYGWNWTYWYGVLKPLVQEVRATSPLGPALIHADTGQALPTSESTTQAIGRVGATSDEIWVMAARSGTGSASVTISGLPVTASGGTVYTEGRTIPVSNGSFTDTFARWDVHVYRFSTSPPPAAPTVTSFSPPSGLVGSPVTIRGTSLAGTTSVRFNGTSAGFTVVSDGEVTASVPGGATSGPISLTTGGGTATSASSFTVSSAPTAAVLAHLAVRRHGASVVVSWRTAAEARVLGFDVLRVRAGRSTKVNRRLVPARGGAARGAAYRLVDRSPRRTTSYRLVTVRLDGTRSARSAAVAEAGR
jgi:hypothetical protein